MYVFRIPLFEFLRGRKMNRFFTINTFLKDRTRYAKPMQLCRDVSSAWNQIVAVWRYVLWNFCAWKEAVVVMRCVMPLYFGINMIKLYRFYISCVVLCTRCVYTLSQAGALVTVVSMLRILSFNPRTAGRLGQVRPVIKLHQYEFQAWFLYWNFSFTNIGNGDVTLVRVLSSQLWHNRNLRYFIRHRYPSR